MTVYKKCEELKSKMKKTEFYKISINIAVITYNKVKKNILYYSLEVLK